MIVDYKDDATAFNGEKKGTIMGKGVINNRVTNFLMQKLEKEGVPTHFVKELSERETAGQKGVHRSPGGHRPQHRRRLLLQALRRGGGHGAEQPRPSSSAIRTTRWAIR